MARVLYFPRYSQKENFITNNTLLLMSRLYDNNRRRFQRFLAQLLEDKADAPISDLGLRISQQIGTGRSVLDGYLHQPAIRIGIETKRAGVEFYPDQLLNHVDAFESGTSGYLILLRPRKVDLTLPLWEQLQHKAKQKNVLLASVTFQEVIESFRSCLRDYDEEMHDLIDDFEAFCSEHGLLETDAQTMFVPPCGQSFDVNVRYRLYFCPKEWSRRRVRYLGIYKEKSVQYIGVIGRVVCAELSDGMMTTQDEMGRSLSVTAEEAARIRGAIDEAKEQMGSDITHNHKFFLCDQLCETHYVKTTRGGIMGHRYLYLGDYINREMSLGDLAELLREHTWE